MLLKISEKLLDNYIEEHGFTSSAFAIVVSTIWGNLGWDYFKCIYKKSSVLEVIYDVSRTTLPFSALFILMGKFIDTYYYSIGSDIFSVDMLFSGHVIFIVAFIFLWSFLFCFFYERE